MRTKIAIGWSEDKAGANRFWKSVIYSGLDLMAWPPSRPVWKLKHHSVSVKHPLNVRLCVDQSHSRKWRILFKRTEDGAQRNVLISDHFGTISGNCLREAYGEDFGVLFEVTVSRNCIETISRRYKSRIRVIQ